MATKKKPKKKKEKVTEIFEVEKKGKQKIVKKQGTQEVLVEKKDQLKNQNRILKNILVAIVLIFILITAIYFYVQSQIHFNYKDIEFEAERMGEGQNTIIFYRTTTFLEPNDGTETPFGFRLRTKPSVLKRIPFEGLEEFDLTSINGYSYGENTFDCEGDGIIAMVNLQRLFEKINAQFLYDEEATCDSEGRYNYFNLKYGDKTEIKKVGEKCYDIIVEGNDEKCEILPATEKLMVEVFVKYRDYV